MNFDPIGIIHTPHDDPRNMPIQPKGAKGVTGTVEIDPQFTAGLKDLDGFSHIYLIYCFHKAPRVALSVTPFMDTVERGVYSTRSPLRPNHIGISIVKLIKVQGNTLTIEGADMLNGTPLLDIKPYIEKFDHPKNSVSGWMKASAEEVEKKRSDDRFA